MTSVYNYPVNFNIPKISFRSNTAVTSLRSTPSGDGFVSNPLNDNFGNRSQIEAEAKSNPRIREIMNEYNIPVKVNIEELEKLQKGHLMDTRVTAAKIYSSLPEDLKQEVNIKNLQEAAMLHDYGKVLIPQEILNKNGALNSIEREIMELHSELGYELLKNKGLDDKTLNLVKYHHQNSIKNGYPCVDCNYEHGIDAQILNIADKYSALTENRSYKQALSREDALAIIKADVEDGFIAPEVYEALRKAV